MKKMAPRIKLRLLLTLLVCSLDITNCACGGKVYSESSSNQEMKLAAPLTIDDAGVIPAFSDTSVSTQIYFHNNSSEDINDLTFTYEANVAGVKLINANNRSIRAGSKGSLQLILPELAASQRGTLLITANYSFHGERKSFQQAISFHPVATTNPGVYLSSGALASGFGNQKVGYTTLYVYGSGAEGSHYKVDDNLQLDAVLGQEISGKLEGSEIVSHQVVALELETQKLNKTNGGTISLGAVDMKTQEHYTSYQFVTNLGQSESGSQAAIIQSKVPMLNTQEQHTGKAYVYNAGTAVAKSITIKGVGGVSTHLDHCNDLAPGQSCSVSFNVNGEAGDGHIEVNYQDGQYAPAPVIIPVVWYKPIDGVGQFAVEPENDPIVLSGASSDYKANTKVMIANIGLGAIDSVKVSAIPLSGAAHIQATSNPDCQTLGVNQKCEISYTASDRSLGDSGAFAFTAEGKAASGPFAVTPLTAIVAYNVQKIIGTLKITALPSHLSIMGDNQDWQEAIITFTNTSDTTMPNINEQLDKTHLNGIKVKTTDNCMNKPLAAGQDCVETLVLEPQTLPAGVNSLNGEIAYTAIDGDGEQRVVIDLAVQPQDSFLQLEQVIAYNAQAGGEGTPDAPIIFQAGQGGQKFVEFIYKNVGKNALRIKGINPPVDMDKAWAIAPDSSCYMNNNFDGYQDRLLAGGESCTIKFENTLYQSGASQTETNLDLPLPEMVIAYHNDKHNLLVVPTNAKFNSDNIVHIMNYQAVITDLVIMSPDGKSVVVSHDISGLEQSGYQTLTEKSNLTNGQFLLPGAAGSIFRDGCSLASDSSNYTVREVCTFTSTQSSFMHSYNLNFDNFQVADGSAVLNMTSKLFGGEQDALEQGWSWFSTSELLTGGINQGQVRLPIDAKVQQLN